MKFRRESELDLRSEIPHDGCNPTIRVQSRKEGRQEAVEGECGGRGLRHVCGEDEELKKALDQESEM